MPNVKIPHNPELSVQELRDAFSVHLPGYTIHEKKNWAFDFMLSKDDWKGVTIKLVQRKSKTIVRVNGVAPSGKAKATMIGLFFVIGIFSIIIMQARWAKVIKEVSEVIKRPDFLTKEIELGLDEEFEQGRV